MTDKKVNSIKFFMKFMYWGTNFADLKKSSSQSMSTALEPFEPEEGGFATTEIRQSRRSLARIGNGTLRSQHSR